MRIFQSIHDIATLLFSHKEMLLDQTIKLSSVCPTSSQSNETMSAPLKRLSNIHQQHLLHCSKVFDHTKLSSTIPWSSFCGFSRSKNYYEGNHLESHSVSLHLKRRVNLLLFYLPTYVSGDLSSCLTPSRILNLPITQPSSLAPLSTFTWSQPRSKDLISRRN